MKTRAQLQADRDIEVSKLVALRDAAGAQYAAAATEYVRAWTEVHALDMVLASRTGDHTGFGAQPVPAGHPKYLRDPVHGAASDRAKARTVEIVASLAAADSALEQFEAAERAAGRAHLKSLEA